MEKASIRGITHDDNIAKVSFVRVPDCPGIAARLFEAIGEVGVNIHLIVQAQSHEGTNDITFVVAKNELARLRPTLDRVVHDVGGEDIEVDESVATVSVVGEGVHREPGIAAAVFRSLADAGINIELISTSNLMISCVIPATALEKGVKVLHEEFFEEG